MKNYYGKGILQVHLPLKENTGRSKCLC